MTALHRSAVAGLLTSLIAMWLVTVPGKSIAADSVIPHAQDKPPGPALSPQQAIANMTVPEGFQVELVAAEPDIVNPVAMTFDERGRVWITESLEYPRLSPGKGRDRIKILEDTNGDGRADRFTVFADGLNIPSGIAVGHGGVWVANSPDILFLQDTDGDDRADTSEVIVTGFGRTDTHELPNSLTWGPDGYLYGLNGVFNFSHVVHHGQEHVFTCALFRIDPRTRDFELFAEGTSNPWGVTWNPVGDAFISACVIDHLWHLTQSGYYHRQGGPYPPHTWKIESIVKHKHQKAAYCGIHYYDSDAYPPEYRNRLYMGNIHGNCLNVDVLEDAGSTYFARPNDDFLSANDAWFMPVVQKTGPDGCLWVLDWYDRYHCYQDARRDPDGIDRLKGRLYRIRHKDSPAPTAFDLGKETDEQLIPRLGSGNGLIRDLAQRLLSERAADATRPALERMVLDPATPSTARMHALWSLVGSGRLQPAFHRRLLAHDDQHLAGWGVRAAANMRHVEPEIAATIASLADDDRPRVALQVAIAAGRMEQIDAIDVLYRVLKQSGNDTLIPHVVWQNLHPRLEQHSTDFLSRVSQDDLRDIPAFAEILPRVADRILSTDGVSADAIASLFRLLMDAGQAGQQPARACLQLLAQRIQTGELAADQRNAIRTRMADRIEPLLTPDSKHPLHIDAAIVAASWGDQRGIRATEAVFRDTNIPHAGRLRALGALVGQDGDKVLAQVRTVLSNRTGDPAFTADVIATLSRMKLPAVAAVLLDAYGNLDASVQPKVIETLTARGSWGKSLLAAIADNRLPASAVNANQVRKLLLTGDADIADAVARVWGTIRTERDPARTQFIDQMRTTIRSGNGDPHRGIPIFEKLCAQCHKIHGKGTEVGPDITLNGRASFEQLLSNVFDPSLVIGAAYQPTSIATTDGRVLTGLLVEDNAERVVLKVQGGKLETIAIDHIDERQLSRLSMMPEGIEKQLSPQEIIDLFAFLIRDKHPDDPTAEFIPGGAPLVERASTQPAEFPGLVDAILPGFTTSAAGEGGVAIVADHFGRPALRTHPVDRKTPCVLTRTVLIPENARTILHLAVSHHPDGDWRLLVLANGQRIRSANVNSRETTNGWMTLDVDLSPFAGQQIELQLLNQPTDWKDEFGFWGQADLSYTSDKQ